MTNKFKKIQAVFTAWDVSKNQRFKKGSKIVIKRYISGATHYGDCSGHSVECDSPDFIRYFDTRYDGIRPIKDEWVILWEQWFEREYWVKIKLDSYSESWEPIGGE